MSKKKISLILIAIVVCVAIATGVSLAIWADTDRVSGKGDSTTGDWNASAEYIKYDKIMSGDVQIGWRVVGYSGTVTKLVVPATHNNFSVLEVASKLSNNSLVTEVILPKTITKIDDNALVSFTRLTKVTIKDATFIIGANSFTGCRNLTAVDYSGSKITAMGEGAFSGCNALTTKPTVHVEEVPNE